MSLKNLVQPNLVSCERDTSIREAARLMDRKGIGALLVVENGEPCGIVTDRDIVVRCVAQDTTPDRKVEAIMSTDVECVTEDDGLYDVIPRMGDTQVRRIPLVDKTGQAIGVLSFGDVFQLLVKELSFLAGSTTPERTKIKAA